MPRPRTKQPKSDAWAALGMAIEAARIRAGLSPAEASVDLASLPHFTNVEHGVEAASMTLIEALEHRLDASLIVLYRRAIDSDAKSGSLRAAVRKQIVYDRYPILPTEYARVLTDGSTEPVIVKPLARAQFTPQAAPRLVTIESDLRCQIHGPEAGATYTVTLQLEAHRDGVASYSYWRHNLPRQFFQRVELAVEYGGALTSVQRYGWSHRHTIRLDRVLLKGQTTDLRYVMHMIRPSQPMAAVTSTGHRWTQRSRVRVEFQEQRPWALWYFQNTVWPVGFGQPSMERLLHSDDSGATWHDFRGREAEGDHGIEWFWGPPPWDGLVPQR